MTPTPKKDQIAVKLFKGFSLLAAVLVTVTFLLHTYFNNYLTKQLDSRLFGILDFTVSEIESYVVERKRDVTALAQMPGIADAIADLDREYREGGADSEAYRKADLRWRPFLTAFKDSAGYHDLFLISADGDLIFTVIHEPDFATNLTTGPYRSTGLADVFRRVKVDTRAHVSRLSYYEPSRTAAAFIAAPVFRQGAFMGVVALQINKTTLLDIVKNYTALGNTGEILALAAIEEDIVYVNDTRHDPDAGFQRKADINVEELSPLHLAVRGKRGRGRYTDYRGRQSEAVWDHAPSMNWGVVVKMDREEAFLPIRQLRYSLLLLLMIILLGVALLSRYIQQQISQPLEQLTQITSVVGHGNLHVHVEPKLLNLKNEIGYLAVAFERMLKNLDEITASRDELNRLTQELSGQKHNLQKAYDNLEKMQGQLIKSEKLASIGYLSAGIAHEINNPLTMIRDNLTVMADYAEGLLAIIARCDDLHTAVNSKDLDRIKQIVDNVHAQKQESRLEHVREDLPQLLAQTQEGTERIRKVVKGLLTFARGDEGKMAPVNLRDIFEGVLGMIAGQLEDRITLTKDYDDKRPVMGNRHLIGQVFVNILTNAIHAIPQTGKIAIRTYDLGGQVFAVISDTGKGIAPDALGKIWNPFYTDKPPGQGTGLGLSISHTIIEQHHGEISAISEPGQGTTITISLPVAPEDQ